MPSLVGSEMCIRDRYTAGAQHSSSRLSLWRPAPQEKLLLCVKVAAPEKRIRPAHGWKGRPRSWRRSARWYQAFCFFFAGTRRSVVPHTKTKTIVFHTKTKVSRTHTDGFFGGDVSIRNSLRSNKIKSQFANWEYQWHHNYLLDVPILFPTRYRMVILQSNTWNHTRVLRGVQGIGTRD